MKTKLFLEKRLIMADGSTGSTTPENAPPPPSVLTQNNTTTEVNTTGQEQTPGQQVAPQHPQGSPLPAPEAMQAMPQMPGSPEAKPVTPEDINKANAAAQKKGESRILASEGIVKRYEAIPGVEPFTPKA